MNDRIKELALQANIDFIYDPTETPMRAFAECWEDELEKFVELIVKECALVVHKKTGPKSALNVLEHFGVEE